LRAEVAVKALVPTPRVVLNVLAFGLTFGDRAEMQSLCLHPQWQMVSSYVSLLPEGLASKFRILH
jgi:hypothetical protein